MNYGRLFRTNLISFAGIILFSLVTLSSNWYGTVCQSDLFSQPAFMLINVDKFTCKVKEADKIDFSLLLNMALSRRPFYASS